MKEQKWIVTAVNNLTGEREAISRPHSYLKTKELLIRAKRDQRRHREQACYSLLRMERFAEQEGTLPFPPLKTSNQSVETVKLYIPIRTFPARYNLLYLQPEKK